MKNRKYILYLYINILLISNLLYGNYDNSEIEYIIYTSNDLIQPAILLSEFYNNDIADEFKLKTKIINNDTLTNTSFPDSLFNNYYNSQNNSFNNLKYLLIIGNENKIPPIKHLNIVPSDDYFSTQNYNTSNLPMPLLPTGRLIVNNNEQAQIMINNIINYISNSYVGNWKSELLLFCDNQYKSSSPVSTEIKHTEYSDIIYQSLKNNLNINCLYGLEFPTQQSIDWYTQPLLNNQIIQRINQGLSIINYIGHGTSELLADEDILTFSDLDLISINNNQLPIWVVGTCAFGNYLNQNCFAEKLLSKGDAAIAVISTTSNISYEDNWGFIDNFYNEHLKDYITDEDNNDRLGDIVFKSKNNVDFSYKFHLFGDPAMPIIIPKQSHAIFDTTHNATNGNIIINIGSKDTILVNSPYASHLSSLKINDVDNNNKIYFNDDNGDLDSLEYNTPGNILYFGQSIGDSFEFMLPLDVNIDNMVQIKLHNESYNSLQYINNINLQTLSQNNIDDNQVGPNILIKHKNLNISNDSWLYPPYKIKIEFEDEDSPINISGLNYHNLRFWIDDDESQSIILNDLFRPVTNEENESGYKGFIDLTIDKTYFKNEKHILNVQAWDLLINSNIVSYEVNIFQDNKFYNIYNFPNPFSDITFFTFHYSESKIVNVIIDVFTLDGKQIKTINQTNISPIEHTYYRLPNVGWDGKNKYGESLTNGTYIYQLQIFLNSDGNNIYDGIHKLTKMK